MEVLRNVEVLNDPNSWIAGWNINQLVGLSVHVRSWLIVFYGTLITMKTNFCCLAAVALAALISCDRAIAQGVTYARAVQPVSVSYVVSPRMDSSSSSTDSTSEAAPHGEAIGQAAPSTLFLTTKVKPFSTAGIDLHVGLMGAGFDVATPLSRRFNLRAGADFFSYGTTFQEEGANVTADLRLRSGHASLDWFPFGGRFRLSPLIVFGNNTGIQATARIPSGDTVTLNGQDYISSYTDPLHGSGSVDFRKVAPGFSLGFGNIIPRSKSHFSIPFEAGFYYVGQPHLKVAFTGSACDPTEPAAIGCQPVNQDAGFQHDLQAFIARNNNNLSYASFLPILSIGIGYKF